MYVEITPTKNKVCIDYSDIWNVDVTLAKIIYPLLVEYKHKTKSVMMVDDSDLPPGSWGTDKDKHDYVLDKMIESFRVISSDDFWELQGHYDIQEGINLFSKYFLSLWS